MLPAGNKNAEATEILRSERTSSLLASLAADPRRIVLIDSPPLLVTSEAGVVTSLAGQVVVVVKAAETPQEAVLRAHRDHHGGQTGEPRAEPGRRGTRCTVTATTAATAMVGRMARRRTAVPGRMQRIARRDALRVQPRGDTMP